ncbi:MAG: hypothetical protein J2P28_09900, partial [Actinobacteria bacterium]|nr:hypothetical protein [Actinomycetota bacterium]
MGTAMEAYRDFGGRDRDIGRHVDQVTEDLTRLRIVVSAHAAGHDAVEAGGEDEQGHVEVGLEGDRGGERVNVEEAHRVAQRVLDEHAPGIAGDQLLG